MTLNEISVYLLHVITSLIKYEISVYLLHVMTSLVKYEISVYLLHVMTSLVKYIVIVQSLKIESLCIWSLETGTKAIPQFLSITLKSYWNTLYCVSLTFQPFIWYAPWIYLAILIA